MKRLIALGGLMMVGLSVAYLVAQAPPQKASLADPIKVKDNLYVIGGSNPSDQATWTGGNTALFITNTGVVVVDTKLPGYGPQLLSKIKGLTDKPVTTIIN